MYNIMALIPRTTEIIPCSNAFSKEHSTFYPSGISDELTARKDSATNDKLEDLDYNAILRIDNSLTKWLVDMLPHLAWRPAPVERENDIFLLRQVNVLKLRYKSHC